MSIAKAILSGISRHVQQPCLLCQLESRMQEKPICAACDGELPWLSETFQRHDCTITAACHYQWPVDRLIHLYKYQQRLDLLPILSHMLIKQPKPKVHAIVPIPLSLERLKDRGYNQSLLLAKHLSKYWDIPVWQPLARLDRPAQQTLSAHERLQNVEGVFYPQQSHNPITPRRVLIIDDVVTTGSTLFHFAKALHHLGVKDCQHLVLAKAD